LICLVLETDSNYNPDSGRRRVEGTGEERASDPIANGDAKPPGQQIVDRKTRVVVVIVPSPPLPEFLRTGLLCLKEEILFMFKPMNRRISCLAADRPSFILTVVSPRAHRGGKLVVRQIHQGSRRDSESPSIYFPVHRRAPQASYGRGQVVSDRYGPQAAARSTDRNEGHVEQPRNTGAAISFDDCAASTTITWWWTGSALLGQDPAPLQHHLRNSIKCSTASGCSVTKSAPKARNAPREPPACRHGFVRRRDLGC